MATAIYVRISEDKTGQEAGVTRQLQECREFCAAHGWTDVVEYQDNDISAVNGKVRPGFERLLVSRPDRIVVFHTDRLVKVTHDLERVIALNVNVHGLYAGHLDLSTPAGRAVARTVTAWAQYEGEQKAIRQKAANRQRARQGVSVWSRRPYGFDRDGHEVFVVEQEAQVLRDAAAAVLAGEPLATIAADLNGRAVPTSLGGQWTVTTLRRCLLNPRVAGRVHYLGEDYAAAPVAILDETTAERVRLRLTDPSRKKHRGTAVKHLLSGLLRCGRCGETMFAAPTYATATRPAIMTYRCLGCYLTRRADLVDEVVTAAVVARMAAADAVGLLAPRKELRDLQVWVDDLRGRRDALAGLLADGLLSEAAVREQAKDLTGRIEALEREIDTALGASPLAPLLAAKDVRAAVGALPLRQFRAVVRVLMTVDIMPAGKGVRFDPTQVRITWRQ